MSDKIRQWTIDNTSVNLRAVSELLTVLRSEGYEELPKTAHKLLEYKNIA